MAHRWKFPLMQKEIVCDNLMVPYTCRCANTANQQFRSNFSQLAAGPVNHVRAYTVGEPLADFQGHGELMLRPGVPRRLIQGAHNSRFDGWDAQHEITLPSLGFEFRHTYKGSATVALEHLNTQVATLSKPRLKAIQSCQ